MAPICSIDEDNDYENDLRSLRSEAALIKIKQPVDDAGDERSIRRLRRHSANVKYLQSSRKREGKRRQADEKYDFFLNYYDKGPPFHHADDTDLQYHKFLSFLKPLNMSYALDLVKVDGTSDLVTYEDVNETSDQPVHNANPDVDGQENNGGMLHHVSGKYRMDIKKGNCFKSTDKQSETLGMPVTEAKMGAENARHPPLEESLIVGSEHLSLKSVGTDLQMCFIDKSYQFYLSKKFNLKVGENLSCRQDLKKHDIQSVVENTYKETKGKYKLTSETPRKHKSSSKVCSEHTFDGHEGKKPRLSQTSGKGINMAMDAKYIQDANGYPKSRMTIQLRQNMGRKNERKRSHCQKLESSQGKFLEKSIQKDVGRKNGKQSKIHRLAEDNHKSGKRSVAPKVSGKRSVDQEANGTANPLGVTSDDKLQKNHRLSGYSKQATKRKFVDRVGEDATGLFALHGVQASGKKPGLNNHNQPGSELKFDRLISNSYKTFLSGLGVKEGYLVFQSEEGKVIRYEKDLKGSSTDSDTDSDSVIIIGARKNGIYHNYFSSMPKKPSFQELELDKRRTSKESPFRKKLMNILRKPYDRDEYESLMEIAGKRRPLEGYRDLRGGRKGTYELESLGKSYLDHFKDAAEAIKRCKGDRQKVLIILRGFIYWLEHIADADQFKPWMDKECLEVQPQK